MKATLLTAWERMSLYLPVILMGVLALGTYWLVRSTPSAPTATPERPMRHDPDYFMRDFSVRTFNATGQLKSEVSGAKARHFPDTDVLSIDQVRIQSYSAEGHLTLATAHQALTNADASEVQLFGSAHVLRDTKLNKVGRPLPRMEFKGEFLHAFLKTERVISNKPVELRRGDDVFMADALEFDNLAQTIQLTGRVRGTFQGKTRP